MDKYAGQSMYLEPLLTWASVLLESPENISNVPEHAFLLDIIVTILDVIELRDDVFPLVDRGAVQPHFAFDTFATALEHGHSRQKQLFLSAHLACFLYRYQRLTAGLDELSFLVTVRWL
jgi:hypothetical protein